MYMYCITVSPGKSSSMAVSMGVVLVGVVLVGVAPDIYGNFLVIPVTLLCDSSTTILP